MSTTLLVIAKQPVPGRVKTRLTPPLTPEQAADVAGAALLDTLDAADRTQGYAKVLAFAGDPTGWERPGWRTVAQPVHGGLDVRLVSAFQHAGGPSVLVGMDTPQVTAGLLGAFDTDRFDACLGPAPDGGFWAIGFRDPAAAACILGVPMSVPHTGAEQLRRMRDLGLSVQLLAALTDVDDIASAREVAQAAPHGRFAAALTRALGEAAA